MDITYSHIWILLSIICIINHTNCYNQNNPCYTVTNEIQCNKYKHLECYWNGSSCMTYINTNINIIYLIDTEFSNHIHFENELQELTSPSTTHILYHTPSLINTSFINNLIQIINLSIIHNQNLLLVIFNHNNNILCPIQKLLYSHDTFLRNKNTFDGKPMKIISYSYTSNQIICSYNTEHITDNIYQFNINPIKTNVNTIISKLSWDIYTIFGVSQTHTISKTRHLLQDDSNEDFPRILPLLSVNSNCVSIKNELDVIFLIDNSCGLDDNECTIQSQGILDIILSIIVDNN
eukprot:362164_1